MQDGAHVSIVVAKPSCGCAKRYYCLREAEVEILWLGVWTLQKLLERTSEADGHWHGMYDTDRRDHRLHPIHHPIKGHASMRTVHYVCAGLKYVDRSGDDGSTFPAVPDSLAFWGTYLNNWCGCAAWNLEQIFPAAIWILINYWTEE